MKNKVFWLFSILLIAAMLLTACTPAEEAPVVEEPAAEEPVAEEPAAEVRCNRCLSFNYFVDSLEWSPSTL